MATVGTEERHALTFLWKIKNIGFYEPEIHSTVINSPDFTSSTSQTRWYLRLCPKGEDEEDERFRIYLNPWNEEIGVKIDCEASILGRDGSPLVTMTAQNHLITDNNLICMPNCPMHKEVFVSSKSAFLPNDTLTVRCRVWKSVGNYSRSECIFLRSRLELSVNSFQWPIEAFSHFPLGKKVTTRVEVCIAGRKQVFWMHLSLKGSSYEEAVAQIELASLSINTKLLATLKVSVLDSEEKAMKSVEGKHLFDQSEDNQSWVLPKIAKRKELLEEQSNCLNGDLLTLLFEFTAVFGISHFLKKSNFGPLNMTTDVARKDSICSGASCKSSVSLAEDFLSLYRDQTGSDFELSSGDVSFPVHKQVLMARSPVFRAMFSSNMKESGTHSLEVPDVDAHTLNRMLTFLYAGTVDPELQWEGAARLYYAADKYQVQSLKHQCSSVLQSTILVSNVGDIVTLADRHQDQELTSFVHDYFLRNFKNIMLSDEWDTFMERDPSLAGKTMKEVYKKKHQMTSQ